MNSRKQQKVRTESVIIPLVTFVVGTLLGTILDFWQHFDGRADQLDAERKEVSALLGEKLDDAKESAPTLDCYLSFDSQATDVERRISAQLRNYVARSAKIRNDPLGASREELADIRMDVGIISTWIDSADVLQQDVITRLPPSQLELARAKCDG